MKYKNILQIDDDFDDCDFFEEALKTVSDASYTAVHNPVDALNKLINKEVTPDLIIVDINMPFMTGPELIMEIKKRQTIKDIPVIILSTSSLCTPAGSKFSGVEKHLIKPYTLSELRDLILKSINC